MYWQKSLPKALLYWKQINRIKIDASRLTTGREHLLLHEMHWKWLGPKRGQHRLKHLRFQNVPTLQNWIVHLCASLW